MDQLTKVEKLIGERFGRWTTLSVVFSNKKYHLKCRCDCGIERDVQLYRLISGRSRSCGCWNRDRHRKLWEPVKRDGKTLFIPLSQNKYAIIDSEDLSKIRRYKWCLGPNGHYACSRTYKKTVRMHRLIISNSEGMVDHINGNTLDNRRSNLRVCTPAENSRNRFYSKLNKTGYKGVFFDKNLKKFRSSIGMDYKHIYLGVSNSAENLSKLYENKAKELHGDFFCFSKKYNEMEIPESLVPESFIETPDKNRKFKIYFEKNKRELIGKKFGQLKVLNKCEKGYWECLCDCGKIKIVHGDHLVRGSTKSCGCIINKNKIKKWKPVELNEKIFRIPLSQNKYAIIDKEDFDKIKNMSWYYDSKGYARNRNGIMMHRIVMQCPDKIEVDHKNHNTLDNRKENLRICTRSQNQANKQLTATNTSGFKGVSFNKKKNKFSASIRCNGKQFHLGYFSNSEEAHQEYSKKGKELFGEFFFDGKIKSQ